MGNKEDEVDVFGSFLGASEIVYPVALLARSDRLHISGRPIQPTGPAGVGCRDKAGVHIYCTATSTAIRRCSDPNHYP